MSNWRIVRYESAMAGEWDRFVRDARNATFLFLRDYMDYHADRFADCSWMAYKGNRLLAMLPANLTEDGVLRSHGGLSYGGWILPAAHLDGADLLEIFSEACSVWRDAGIKSLDYKPMPTIYCRQPSQEDEYALFRLGAQISEINLSATVDLSLPVRFNQLQRRHLAKALKENVVVREMNDIDAFMKILEECLRERHQTNPVHTAAEMKLLASRFPENIRFFSAEIDGAPHACVCIYDTGIVAHAQYIATTSEGRRLNMLTPLFHKLMTEIFADRRYFDFGISNEDHGRYLNEGLLRQKYSYGATGTVTRRYNFEL